MRWLYPGAQASPSSRPTWESYRRSSPMPERAWGEVIEALLTGRTQPPRKNGLTMVIDKGLGPAATADLLEMCGGVIDHWKCAFGTSAFVPADALRRKLVSLAAHCILTYPGGTLL